MAHPLTLLGAIHTVISLVPLVAGIYGFVRYYRIDPHKTSGVVYLIGLLLSVVSAFGVSSTGGLNAGHAFGVVVMLVALAGAVAPSMRLLGRLGPYLGVFGLSFSFLLSLVPGTNETLTRLPPSHPLADHPLAPVVMTVLLVWLVIFVLGFAAQCRHLFKQNRAYKGSMPRTVNTGEYS